ncbi:MAG: enoyl-CoA hydratase/isomerase family protein [Legionellales bacterium]
MLEEVLFSQEGQIGFITLNRPNALNALTLTMILAMQKQLQLWKEDHSIHAVLLRAAPGNAFCAGGDVRWLYNAGKAHDSQQTQFFWHEYRLNHFIHHLGKPYISLIDGMVMGGGVGVALHGSHPVACERFVFAMPETSIGFFPDIGASYLLNRCPGHLGLYLGLTGNRLDPQDALQAGLVKQTVRSENMPQLVTALLNEDLSTNAHARVDACLLTHAMAHAETDLSTVLPVIDRCFSQPTVELIRASLQNIGLAWAAKVDSLLEKKCPLSLKVTLAQLQKTKDLSLAECLKIDYDLARHFMQGRDFYEGVRALLIDKDKNPQWDPPQLHLVSDTRVLGFFEAFDDGLEFG